MSAGVCGGCGDGWASLMKVEAVDVCGNDGGGGDCEADGREATGSTEVICFHFLISILSRGHPDPVPSVTTKLV